MKNKAMFLYNQQTGSTRCLPECTSIINAPILESLEIRAFVNSLVLLHLVNFARNLRELENTIKF